MLAWQQSYDGKLSPVARATRALLRKAENNRFHGWFADTNDRCERSLSFHLSSLLWQERLKSNDSFSALINGFTGYAFGLKNGMTLFLRLGTDIGIPKVNWL